MYIYFVRAMYKTLKISFAFVMKYDCEIILVKFEINLKIYIYIYRNYNIFTAKYIAV